VVFLYLSFFVGISRLLGNHCLAHNETAIGECLIAVSVKSNQPVTKSEQFSMNFRDVPGNWDYFNSWNAVEAGTQETPITYFDMQSPSISK
jgi:hypothetical protein